MPKPKKVYPGCELSGKSIRTLIVDDSAQFRETVSTFLASLPSFEPLGEASNGPEAVRAAARHQPDLVLLDLQLPGMNGLDAMEQIRPDSPGSRVVILTMHDDDTVRNLCLERGADGFVSKNSMHKDLPAVVRRLFTSGTSKR